MDGAIGGSDAKFGSKPARGWLNADSLIATEGITFNVRVSKLSSIRFYIVNERMKSANAHLSLLLSLFSQYIGCLEIKASMKVLDFTLRSSVAK